jgi:Bacterial protein of unknown function (Gcw_chp)
VFITLALGRRALPAAPLIIGLTLALPATADVFGSVGLVSDNIERGVSQSERKPSANASLGWRGASGFYTSLGAASVSKEQYQGSGGYKLAPELGYGLDIDEAKNWRAGLALRGQVFPGASGPWFGQLPARLQTATVQAKHSNYGTAELGASLTWKALTLSFSRSLTDYLGLAATETGPLGMRLLQSKGTTYLGLDGEWPLGERLSVSVGAGRLRVPNFEDLGYTDWRLGMSTLAYGLRLGLQASGSNANGDNYRLRSRINGSAQGTSNARKQALVGTVSWSF